MKRVLLIDMPFGDVRCPSLALGLFKARFERDGIECRIENLKLLFASMVGWDNYLWLTPLTALLAGERTFARHFFGSDISSDTEYFEYCRQYLGPKDLQRFQEIGSCVEPFLKTCMANIPWDKYDIIGFTSMFEQNVSSLALAYEIKRRFPEKAIVFGGANCEDVMGPALHRCFPFVDYVCCGEADSSFPELVKRLTNGENVSDVPGIVFRDGKNSVSTDPLPGTTDMDALPFPNYDDYFLDCRTYSAPSSIYPTVLVEASRGCWWGAKIKCTFCGLNGTTIQSRAKQAPRVLEEIAWLVSRYQATYVRMVDNMLNPDYFDTLLPELKARNSGVRFFVEIRPTLTRDQVKLLADAGVSDIQAGIENLSTNVLRLMKKGSTTLSGIQTLKWCKQYNVYADWNIILGFPGEQPADYAKNLELVKLLTHLNPPGGVGHFRMDRFSTNFEKAAEMGFTDVKPHPVYRFIYPFSERILNDLVYFFDFKYMTKIDDGGYTTPLTRQVSDWRSSQDNLTCEPNGDGDSLVVHDTRPVAVSRRFSLKGVHKDVMEFCDKAQTIDQIDERLKAEKNKEVPKEQIRAVLDQFVSDKLMVKEGSRYLSLPIMTQFQ